MTRGRWPWLALARESPVHPLEDRRGEGLPLALDPVEPAIEAHEAPLEPGRP
jgi:hypothetical protein